MRVLVCGDRNWIDGALIFEALRVEHFGLDTVVVDGAARGADSLGHAAALELGLQTERFPANWTRYGRGAGPIRNQQMLDGGLDLVMAFHDDLAHSKGTAHMVRIARKAGIAVRVIRH